jgi:hypothetical protein
MAKKVKYKIYKDRFLIASVLCFLLLIFIVSLFILKYKEDEFRITKENCRNETDLPERYACYEGCAIYRDYSEKKGVDVYSSIECYDFCDREFIREICEKEEVNEVIGWFEEGCYGACDCKKIDFECSLTKDCLRRWKEFNDTTKKNWLRRTAIKNNDRMIFDESWGYDEIIILVYNDVCIGESVTSTTVCKTEISKEDLTESWLSQNCCSCHDLDSINFCLCKEDNSEIKYIEFKDKDLDFWRCGDYEVRVK